MTQALEDLLKIGVDLGLPVESKDPEKMNMASVFLVYKDSQQSALNQLMRMISNNAKKYGIGKKTADMTDI